MYRKQGAEIIFFPSAFAAGQMINARAWKHKCVVVSSARKGTSKICDITGEELAKLVFGILSFAGLLLILKKLSSIYGPSFSIFPLFKKSTDARWI
jgi:predicted amidohydrolase